MPFCSQFSDALRGIGSNRGTHILIGILDRSPDDPRLNSALERCLHTLRILSTYPQPREMRNKVLECVHQNLPELAEDPSSLRQYLEILHRSLVQIEQMSSSRPSGHPEGVSENVPKQHVFKNIDQGPGSWLVINSTTPTTATNIRVATGARVFLGTPHP